MIYSTYLEHVPNSIKNQAEIVINNIVEPDFDDLQGTLVSNITILHDDDHKLDNIETRNIQLHQIKEKTVTSDSAGSQTSTSIYNLIMSPALDLQKPVISKFHKSPLKTKR